ncbi:Os09g0255366 [Oryza sativa Japonica Group]|uniref:Os09g0255366 protein n=1 Tax=Oryza sativa subsp. japonica TaxID=39947 RepID=A0A0P0XIY7_ORYSJ|nr:hypothetical protein EE612_046375 [Oryza sativa]BAT07076.1 Os09g0255366 [Oryza sativa Japonica Group]
MQSNYRTNCASVRVSASRFRPHCVVRVGSNSNAGAARPWWSPTTTLTVAVARSHASSLATLTSSLPLLNTYKWLLLVATCSG